MNKFEDLQAFIAVVDTGSFTAAAEHLDGNKSAISRRVSALEERLGAQLLRRTTRTLNLTDTGRSFYDRAVRIVSDLEEAESAVALDHGELRGRLRIALPLSFGVRHMARPITKFSEQNPNVEFDLDLNDRMVDLMQEGIDLGIRIGQLRDSTLIARRIFESRLLLCASPTYLARKGIPQSVGQLSQHDCLVYSGVEDKDHWRWHDDDGEVQKAALNVTMTSTSGDFICEAATSGHGIALQPSFIVHSKVCNGELVEILPEIKWPSVTGHAIYPPARHLSHRVRAFIDFLAEYFSGTPYWDSDCDGSGGTTQ